MNLTQQLTQYCPWNEQEEADRRELLRRLESGEDLYTRSNAAAHLTASAWVVSPDRQQVLMAYHNLYDSWAWAVTRTESAICWRWLSGKYGRKAA